MRRSKIATRAQHSRAEPVAQVYIAELGKYDCRCHARVHFSCVICIAAAFQLLPLFIFSMFIFVYFFTQTDPTRTFATFHFFNVYFRIFLHPDGSHENGRIWIPKRCKGMHCVDLGGSFPTSIYLQKSASIQPRTSPSKFGGKYSILFNRVLSGYRRRSIPVEEYGWTQNLPKGRDRDCKKNW